MKSGVTCDFWSERYVIATRVEFASIGLQIPRQLVGSKREFRQVVTHLGEECDHCRLGWQEVGDLSALSTQTAGDKTEGRQKRERRGQVNNQAPY
jgi:hypothetical protein